ncbi:diguanylate cyclase [Xanthomonas sp. LF07-6]|uniref:sensor domain-containing diguanylate cyclase n=1 Tax=Xanthomonas sp. LF07-6 TaxID=3097550 RepID=UPI002A7FAEFA|nr:diguanylate cyclase [Xanthomonas sp. LF07-6]MDY4338213.1 diguanylate cyclase [Xanthomonas sp. LF07-6]
MKRLCRWCCLLLCLGLVGSALGQELLLQRLAADPPASEVVAGRDDAAFVDAGHGAILYERSKQPTWWRIRADHAIGRDGQPQLVLQSPYLTRVEAWVPGRTGPTRHAIYGADADLRYSTRALVIALPQGLPAGASIWLRVHAPAAMPMPVGIAPLAQVQREDLHYVGWRAFILGSTAVLAILAIALWARLREPIYGYFTANVMCVLLYLLGLGGEARAVPGLASVFASSPTPMRIVAALGGFFIITFQRRQLEMRRQLPRLDQVLRLCALFLLGIAVACLLSDAAVLSVLGNLGLIVGAALLLPCCLLLALRGQRYAWPLLASWTPLWMLCVLRCLELTGWLRLDVAAPVLAHGISLALAISCLLVTFGLAEQILELRRDRDRASRMATVDELTGILTRAALQQRLAEALQDAARGVRPLALAYIDIDHFKRINDIHGHAGGDACLRWVAACARARLRSSDTLGRQGGDEMLLLMPGATLEAARRVAEDIRQHVAAQPLPREGQALSCTLSVGVAQWQRGESVAALLQRADAALYASKAAGRNRVSVSTPSHHVTHQEPQP